MPPRRMVAARGRGNRRGETAAEPETSTTALPYSGRSRMRGGSWETRGPANRVPRLLAVAGPGQ